MQETGREGGLVNVGMKEGDGRPSGLGKETGWSGPGDGC